VKSIEVACKGLKELLAPFDAGIARWVSTRPTTTPSWSSWNSRTTRNNCHLSTTGYIRNPFQDRSGDLRSAVSRGPTFGRCRPAPSAVTFSRKGTRLWFVQLSGIRADCRSAIHWVAGGRGRGCRGPRATFRCDVTPPLGENSSRMGPAADQLRILCGERIVLDDGGAYVVCAMDWCACWPSATCGSSIFRASRWWSFSSLPSARRPAVRGRGRLRRRRNRIRLHPGVLWADGFIAAPFHLMSHCAVTCRTPSSSDLLPGAGNRGA